MCLQQVPLGILAKNENKGEDMVAIMEHFHQYVPIKEISCDRYMPCIDKTVKVSNALGRPILFSGDQLTAARARGAQKAKVNSPSPSARFVGLVPMAEDWHTKVAFLKVTCVIYTHTC